MASDKKAIARQIWRRLRRSQVRNAKMIQVYQIPIPKDRLQAMPKDERVFLLLLGYAANQVSMLQKLLIFSSNKVPPSELEQHISGAQTQMILRLLIGVLNGSWELIRTRFLDNPIGRDYQSCLDQGGLDALAKLKRQFGASNLLNAIRKHFSFHFPESIDVESAFEAACNDADLDDHWKLYFSQYGFNSFFFISDLIIVHGISKRANSADLLSSQEKIMNDVGEAVQNLFEFSKAFTAAAWLKHFGSEIKAEALVAIKNAPEHRRRMDSVLC